MHFHFLHAHLIFLHPRKYKNKKIEYAKTTKTCFSLSAGFQFYVFLSKNHKKYKTNEKPKNMCKTHKNSYIFV